MDAGETQPFPVAYPEDLSQALAPLPHNERIKIAKSKVYKGLCLIDFALGYSYRY